MPSIFVEVEEGDNCPYSLQLVFSALGEPRPIRQVRLYGESPEGDLYDIVAWDNEEAAASEARGVPVEDSGQAKAYLVFGGTGGLRFRPARSATEWDLNASDQTGRSHMVLADEEDIVWG